VLDCLSSQRGTYTLIEGASSSIKCAAGHRQPTEGQTACEPCSAGEYQPERGEAICIPCRAGRYSVGGSSECDICGQSYFRPSANSSATECTTCDAIPGVSCGTNATIATLNMTARYWRHSTATVETHFCKTDGSWSPCHGGGDAGFEGDGYCARGYRGPRCELCDGPAYSRFFDKLEARCHDCGDMGQRTTILVCVMLLLILLAAIGGNPAITRRLRGLDACDKLWRWAGYAQTIWHQAGMRYKVKLLVGFYQCLAAVPSVYNLQPPLGLEYLTRLIHLLELPSEFERIFVVPTACLGDYSTRIWVGSTWPLVLIVACTVCLFGSEFVQRCGQRDDQTLVRGALTAGLQRVLPLALSLTFLVLPSTSTRIFRAFLCETFEFDEGTSRRYLYADLTLSCDSDEYESTKATAFVMLAVWPVGVPMLYGVLLWASRESIRRGELTQLNLATRYMWGDYEAATFWWEPLEMCRKLTLTGWVLQIHGDAEQARVIVALFVSITFFGLNLRFKPLRAQDDASLTTLSHLALILMYTCVLVIKTCEQSPDACKSYGFGDSAKGFFLFFIFFGVSMLGFQLAFEAIAIAYHIRMQKQLRRLRYRGGGFVELPPVSDDEFAHLPGLERSSPCYHLFLSHAWPLGQDVCKLIKQRCREICPSMRVFLDVEDLERGYGAEVVDKSRSILIFAMPVFFEKINCVAELVRAVVRNKQITLLLPDAEVHGEFTTAMIAEIVTDDWVQKSQLDKRLYDWACDWDLKEAIRLPTGADIGDALFRQPPLEWSRITPFQDRTMVLMCQRLLPEAETRGIYLQGAASFKLRKGHVAVNVYCSPHNLGARELAEGLNGIWPGLLRVADADSSGGLSTCDHMLVYLNALTWTHDPEAFAADVREAMRVGLHLLVCNEFPSVLDPGSARGALEFKRIMDATPADLKKWPTNIYSQIAIALKGGELREPGLAILAARVAVRVRLAPVSVQEPEPMQQDSRSSLRSSMKESRTSERKGRKSGQHRHSAANPSQAGNETFIGGIRPGDEEEASAAAGAIPRALAVESSV